MQKHKVALGLGGRETCLAQAADIHSTDNYVVSGKCCRGSALTGMVVDVVSSASGSRA